MLGALFTAHIIYIHIHIQRREEWEKEGGGGERERTEMDSKEISKDWRWLGMGGEWGGGRRKAF